MWWSLGLSSEEESPPSPSETEEVHVETPNPVDACEHVDAADVGQYKLGNILGRGSFGIVKEATHVRSGKKYAIKIIAAEKTDEKQLEWEINNQSRLHHKHVVEIVETIRKDGDTYIVMELVSGGDLYDFIVTNKRHGEPTARRIFQELIAGLEHCHVNKVAHRDLKLENIFLDSSKHVKIGDFGLSAFMEGGVLLTAGGGTLAYAAPERLTKNGEYEGPDVDIWSCGVILYALLCKQLPFFADNDEGLYKKIMRGRYDVPGHVSSEAKDLIAQMLNVDRTQRISIEGIKKHYWFAKDLPPDPLESGIKEKHDENVKEMKDDVDESTENVPVQNFQSMLEFILVPILSTAGVFPSATKKCKSAISLLVSPLCEGVRRKASERWDRCYSDDITRPIT
jgi:serine/threonine protein kinase